MEKKNIVIVSDSSCDLNLQFIEKENIQIVRFAINIGENEYSDGDTINTKKLFEIVDAKKTAPKTAAISPKLYREVFEKFPNDDIIFIGLGSGFSSSYSSASLASQELDNVYLIDSQNLSAGTGLLLYKACMFRREGLSAPEIVEKINEIVPRVRVQFCVNTLKYLHMGGRCSGTSRVVGTTLHLKPIIRVLDNKMIVAKKPIGYNKALAALLDYVKQDSDNLDDDIIFVTHCFAGNEAEYLNEKLNSLVSVKNIMTTEAGCVISSHCGPKCIGILYILKK